MKLLALDTSTEIMSLAVLHGEQVLARAGAGGAQTSHALLPQIDALMREAGLRFNELNAIAFGRGPGSFTGLRTACAVAQGLGFAAGVPLLPVDTLLALAWEAHTHTQAMRILALLDARMGEVYAAHYEFDGYSRSQSAGYHLIAPEKLEPQDAQALVGNACAAYADRLPAALMALPRLQATPSARAMLALAPGLIERGELVAAEHALPVYIRDKVALTTQERLAVKTQSAPSP
jgi:tRNA threonylcarbamoyladenosine biosynthesis protein TsaB